MTKPSPPRPAEEGIALVTVLVVIFTAGMLAAALVATAKLATVGVASGVGMARSRYVAEGAANRAMWLLTADRANYQTADPAETDYSSYDTERYIADGVRHTMDYYGTPVTFTIEDAVSGINSQNLATEFDYLVNAADDDQASELEEELATLLELYTDYADADDELYSSDSYEYDHYKDLDLHPLPRNASPQYREELAMIPGFTQIFKPDSDGRYTRFMLIPPMDMELSYSAIPVLNATREQLKTYAALDDDQADEVLEAIARVKSERAKLSDILDADLLTLLRSNFSWEESGGYTIKILQAAPENRPTSRLVLSLIAFETSGPENDTLTFLEYLVY